MKGTTRFLPLVLLFSSLAVLAHSSHNDWDSGRDSQQDIGVSLPPEVFTSSGQQRAVPCNQCCIYQNQNYSEGSVVKAEEVLLQCQRDDKAYGTNPLVWRRVTP